jgi:murein DD-endopeptidase MepM/ murein hydrolase activator NlpD
VALTRPPGRIRLLLVAAALVGIPALIAPSVVSAAPAVPPVPSIASVTAELSSLASKTKALTDKYNAAQADLRVKQLQAGVAQKDAARASAAYQTARGQLTRIVTADYEESSFSKAGALLTSQNGQSYVDAMNTLSLLSVHRASLVTAVAAAQAKATEAQAAASSLLTAAQARSKALAKQRSKLVSETQALKQLLSTLTRAKQQAALNGNAATAAASTDVINAGTAAARWATDCAERSARGSCGGLSGYVNPFGSGNWTPERTDQGTDWGPIGPQPVFAIGDGVITYSNSNEGGWPDNHFLVYGLTSGSHAGLYVFVAESLTDMLPAGVPVRAGQQIATALPGGSDIEMGFAAPPGTGPNVATPYDGASDGTQTPGGKAFARLLIELGAHPQQDPGSGPDRP